MTIHSKTRYLEIFGAATATLFFITRFYNIMAIPIFTDESIYIRWAEVFKNNAHQVFVSLDDGKQPLFIWIVSGFLRLVHDPLLAGRLASVLAGLITMIGIYFLTNELFENKKMAIGASLVYVIYPFSLLYDKMALYDSLLATFAVWSLEMEVLLVKRRKLGVAIMAAIVIGGGLLTKSSAFFYLYLIPFSLLLFDIKANQRYIDFLKWLSLVAITAAGSVALYSILRLSPNYHYIADKNNVFIYPFTQWIKNPFAYFGTNLHYLFGVLVGYSTVPLLLLAVLAFLIDQKFIREKLLLLAWFIVPFISLALFGKLLFPRYILFMVMPLIVLSVYGSVGLIEKIKRGYILRVLVILLLFAPILHKDYYILTDFAKAPIPKSDHLQYIESFSGGVGVKALVVLLTVKSQHQKIYVATEGTFGLMPQALQDYFVNNNNVQIQGYWPVSAQIPKAVLDAAGKVPTYFVFYAPCPLCSDAGLAPPNWPLKAVQQTPRLNNNGFTTLYQVVGK